MYFSNIQIKKKKKKKKKKINLPTLLIFRPTRGKHTFIFGGV